MNRLFASYWENSYPALVITLGNLSRQPYPADILAHVAERMPDATDAQILERAFARHT